MPDQLEEIRAKLDIVDVVSQYTQLKKAGRSFKALCPFHKEKTPSFIISPDKQIAYCFGCHKGGDIFKFYMEVEGLEFGEAVRQLARRTGVQLTHVKAEDKSQKQKLLEINEKAQGIFVANLYEKEGKKALEYLQKRGLSEQDITTFGLGFGMDSFEDLYKKLVQYGYAKKDLLEVGLAVQKEFSADSIYDKFRNRVIFPIGNLEGEIVAFAGRVLDDSLPKYLNSPETPIYHKGSILYNLDKAREAIRENDFVVVVEGYLDAIAVYTAGIKNVVAVCGTALTDEQVKKIKRFTQNVYFCFDSDAAGLEAMKRNAMPVIKQQLVLKAVPLSKYKDPDEYIRADSDGFLSLLKLPVDFLEFLFDSLGKKYDILTLEGRRSFLNEVAPLLKAFPFQIEKDLYIKKLANLFGTSPSAVLNDIQKSKTFERKDEDTQKKEIKKFDLGHYILGFIFLYPQFMPELREKLPQIWFLTDFLQNIYNLLTDTYNKKGRVAPDELDILAEDKEKVRILTVLVEQEMGDKDESQIHEEFLKLLIRYKKVLSERKKREYLKMLKDLEKDNFDLYEKVFAEYQNFLEKGI